MSGAATLERRNGAAFFLQPALREAAQKAAGPLGVALVAYIAQNAHRPSGFYGGPNADLGAALDRSADTIGRVLARLAAAGVVYVYQIRTDGGRGQRRLVLLADVAGEQVVRPALLDDTAAVVPIALRGRRGRLLTVGDLARLDCSASVRRNGPDCSAPVRQSYARARSSERDERLPIGEGVPSGDAGGASRSNPPEPEAVSVEASTIATSSASTSPAVTADPLPASGTVPQIAPIGAILDPGTVRPTDNNVTNRMSGGLAAGGPMPQLDAGEPVQPDLPGIAAAGPTIAPDGREAADGADVARRSDRREGAKPERAAGARTASKPATTKPVKSPEEIALAKASGRIGAAWRKAISAADLPHVRHVRDGGHFRDLARIEPDAATWARAFDLALADPWIRGQGGTLSVVYAQRERWLARARERLAIEAREAKAKADAAAALKSTLATLRDAAEAEPVAFDFGRELRRYRVAGRCEGANR